MMNESNLSSTAMEHPRDLLGWQIISDHSGDFLLRDRLGRQVHQGTALSCAQQRLRVLEERHGCGHYNAPLRTLGGYQFWCDVLAHGGWRIQRHTISGHHRLLDDQYRRRAWGSRAACMVRLEQMRLRNDLRWPSRHLIIYVHGILRSHHSLAGLQGRLEAAGGSGFAMTYPSSREGVAMAGEALSGLINGLHGIDSFDVVTHSMGSLVARNALVVLAQDAPRCRTCTFLGPPSQGSQLAESMHRWWLYRWITGPAGQDLRPCRAQEFPLPKPPTLVITGNKGFGLGRLRGISADSDGTVTMEEAQLPGAQLLVLPAGHTRVMDHPQVQEAVVEWLSPLPTPQPTPLSAR